MLAENYFETNGWGNENAGRRIIRIIKLSN